MSDTTTAARPRISTYELTMTAVFTAATCIISPLSIPIPISPVPLTLGVFITLLSGALLTPKMAFTSQLIRILLGAVGVPVFAGFQAGFSYLVGPTGGYLIATPFMALVVAFGAKYIRSHSSGKLKTAVIIAASCIVAIAVCYLLGTIWFQIVSGRTFAESLMLCVVPFIAPDLIKAAFVVIVHATVANRIKPFLLHTKRSTLGGDNRI
jgi:biotin transport system substrate-specific component